MTDLQQTPQDEDTQASLRKELKKAMQDDPFFAEQLQSIVNEAAQTQEGATIIHQTAGDDAIQIGVAQRDVTIGREGRSKDGADGS